MKVKICCIVLSALITAGCSSRHTTLEAPIIIENAKGNVEVLNANYIGNDIVVTDRKIPSYFNEQDFVLHSTDPISLEVFLEVLSRSYPNINTIYNRENVTVLPKVFNFEGTIIEALDYAAELFGVFITVDDLNVIVESEKFFVSKIDFSGKTDGEFSISAGLSGTETGGSFGSDLSYADQGDFWSEVIKTLEMILPQEKFSLSIQNSTVSYFATKDQKVNIERYIDSLNGEYSTQFMVEYRVISIDSNAARKMGVGTNLGLSNSTGSTTITSPDVTFLDYIQYADKNVDVFLELGYEEGKLKTIQEGSFLVRNGHTIPINILNVMDYVSEVSLVTNDFSTTQSISTDELSTGISISLQPKHLSDGRIELISGFSKSELVAMETVSGVMLPTTSGVESMSRTLLVPGEYSVVSIFDSANLHGQSKGTTTSLTDSLDKKNSTIMVIANISYDK